MIQARQKLIPAIEFAFRYFSVTPQKHLVVYRSILIMIRITPLSCDERIVKAGGSGYVVVTLEQDEFYSW
jgi:hypothetical protein